MKELFFETMQERQSIWKNRFVLNRNRPWSKDEIFNNAKFTNVYRTLDRNTMFEIKNVIDSNKSLEENLWNVLFFRLFNLPKLFEDNLKEFGNYVIPKEEYNPEIYLNYLNTRDYTITTTSYMISPFKNYKEAYCNILNNVKINFEAIKEKCLEKDFEGLIKILTSFKNLGHFKAYQFFLDITLLNKFLDVDIIKIENNLILGNGSSKGLKIIFNNKDKENVFLLLEESKRYLKDFYFIDFNKDKEIIQVKENNLTIAEIEHWLCEFFKYVRFLNGKKLRKNITFKSNNY